MAEKPSVEVLRSRFFKTYANVPLTLRNEIIAVVGDEPFSWAAANIEIKGKTKKGDEILNFLETIGLLG